MKKIISLLLIAVLSVAVLVSCKDEKPNEGGNENEQMEVNGLEAVATMYKNSKPTKIVADSTQKFSTTTLTGKYVLTTGLLDGKEAAVYTADYNRLRDIESGSGEYIKDYLEDVREVSYYKQGKGVTHMSSVENDGKFSKWDPKAESLIPKEGAIAINLDPQVIKDFKYENHKLTFTVAAKDTEKILGKDNAVSVPVSVEIVDDGASIIGLNIKYTLPKNDAANVAETVVIINVTYTYNIEKISFD